MGSFVRLLHKYKESYIVKNFKFLLFAFSFLFALNLIGQKNIELKNPSMEGNPTQGTYINNLIPTNVPQGWKDCGLVAFPNESPPDIHPKGFWKNELLANDGETYLGMVVRDNETWESVTQRLPQALESGMCYSFTVDLARSDNYWSNSHLNGSVTNYTKPTVLRVWAGTGYCDQNQLLVESVPITNNDWKSYTLEFEANASYRFITFEAFYKTPVLFPYNGHILLDNISSFIAYNCNEEPQLAVAKPKKKKEKIIPPHKRKKKKEEPKKEELKVEAPITASVTKKAKLIEELDRKTIKKGQKIRIPDLQFAADSEKLESSFYPTLNEVFAFMESNADVSIEIGGHTNLKPKNKYCDELSERRAKSVASYLITKGIEEDRISFYGYGKRKPLIRSTSEEANKRNQRVEIKILSVG